MNQGLKRTFAGIFLLVAFTGAAYTLLFLEIQSTLREAGRLREEIRSAEVRRETAGALRVFLSRTESDRAKLDSYLVGNDAVVDFLGSLESLGRAYGTAVEITSVQNKTAPAESPADTLTVTLKGYGTFASVFRFATLLESMPIKLNVEEVRIERESKGTKWNLTANLQTFTLR
jgi:hypothetical protein